MSDTRTVVYVHSGALVVAQVQRGSDGEVVDISVDIGAPEIGTAPVRLYVQLEEADQLRDQLTEALARARARSAPRNDPTS